MFEQNFKNIDNKLRSDAGCGSELDYVEQSSWILFLKYLNDYEKTKKLEAELEGNEYTPILSPEYQWSTWAVPKLEDGSIDEKGMLTGSDLIEFVNKTLFPYLKKFKEKASETATIQYKIGEIFSEIHCKIASGAVLNEVLREVDALQFQTVEDRHEMSVLYESRINMMGNAGRNGGEYYTPRPLIRSIIRVIDLKLGRTVYDGACGSAGFLCEAFTYLREKAKKSGTVEDVEALQSDTFFGKEKKVLPYIIGTMNMILHGVETPNIKHTNTLSKSTSDIEDCDRYDYILANPPFGGIERSEVKKNFTFQTSETAYLFLQHFMSRLREGGHAGIVIKNTFLSNGDATAIRQDLLKSCRLYAILDLPPKVFTAGVKTVVLFFEKGTPTDKIWYYQLNLDRTLGKTNPLNEQDLAEFERLFPTQGESENSWTVNVEDIDPNTFDLSVKNPNRVEEVQTRGVEEILESLENLNRENAEILKELRDLVK